MNSSRPVSTASASGAATLPDSLATASFSELQLLSNGNFHVMVTNTGADIAVSPDADVEVRIPPGAPASPAAERAA